MKRGKLCRNRLHDEWQIHPNNPRWFSCRPCRLSAIERWRKDNPERRRHHHRVQQLRKYGLTPGAYAAMMEAQQHRCAICAEEMAKPCVDHDHATGAVRGVLCNGCNRGLGFFGDDSSRLANAITYLSTGRTP